MKWSPSFQMAMKWFPSFKMGCKNVSIFSMGYEMVYENVPWLRKWLLAAKSPLGFKMATKMLQASKWAAKLPFGCEMISQPHSYPLWNPPFATKKASKFRNGCEMIFKLQNGLRKWLFVTKWFSNFQMAMKWSPNFQMAMKWSPTFKMATKWFSSFKMFLFFPWAAKMFLFFPWAAKMFFFFPFGCKMISKIRNDLQAIKMTCKIKRGLRKHFAKPREVVKMRREPRAPWDHTHKASHSIYDLLKPSKPIAPTKSSSWGDYAT